jgi:hypothetical protein
MFSSAAHSQPSRYTENCATPLLSTDANGQAVGTNIKRNPLCGNLQ